MARAQRDETKERFWRRQVRLWQRSGQSVRAFCQDQGLSEASFYGWRHTLALGVTHRLMREGSEP